MIESLERLARSDSNSGHLTKCLMLVMLCLIAFAPGISRLPPIDRDELRYIQATKQMVASGELVDIRFQNQPRYLQPIGIYWLQTLAVTVSGKGAAAPVWVFRTVSLIAATIAVLACYAAGLRLFGPAAGFIAAIALAGIFMLNFEARIAKTDATVLAAAVAMQAALAHVYLGVRQQRAISSMAPWLFWIAVSVGTIVKGPIVPGLGLLTVAALSIYDRDLSWARKLRPLAGIAIVILVVAPWLVAITAQSGMAFWKEVLGKSLFGKIQGGQQSHGFPPGYYLLTFALTMWPYAVETLRGGLRALRNLRNDPRIAFCVAWVIPMWIIFELVPTKLPHYVLPVFPSLLILMGWALTDRSAQATVLGKWEVWLVRAATFGCIVVTSGLAVLCRRTASLSDGRVERLGHCRRHLRSARRLAGIRPAAAGAGCAAHAAGDARGGRLHRHLHVERAAVGQADLARPAHRRSLRGEQALSGVDPRRHRLPRAERRLHGRHRNAAHRGRPAQPPISRPIPPAPWPPSRPAMTPRSRRLSRMPASSPPRSPPSPA